MTIWSNLSDRPGHDKRYSLDSSKLRIDLGWEPQHNDFIADLEQTIEWYRANETWWKNQQQ